MRDRSNPRIFLEAAASPQHQALVLCLIAQMQADGFEILSAAGVQGYSAPEPVNGLIPDLKGKRNDVNAYGEAERCEELTSEHTMKQIEAFSGRIMTETKLRVPLYLGIPETCCQAAQDFVKKNWPNRPIIIVCCR